MSEESVKIIAKQFKERGYPEIVDERCQCGALRSAHEDTEFSIGHGACPSTKCEQFTWKNYVLKSS